MKLHFEYLKYKQLGSKERYDLDSIEEEYYNKFGGGGESSERSSMIQKRMRSRIQAILKHPLLSITIISLLLLLHSSMFQAPSVA